MNVEKLLQEYREKIEKAAITRSAGGQLNTKEFNRFKRTVVELNQLLQRIQLTPMAAASMDIHAITIAKRQMRAHVEATEPGFTGSVGFPKRTLATKGVILPFDVSLEWIEENIEGNEGEMKLREDFSKAFGNDLLDLAINGDEASADPFLQMNDGWVKLAINDGSVNIDTDPGSVDYLGSIFPKLVDAMPVKYRGPKNEMAIFCSPKVESGYRRQIASRNTALGDRYLVESSPVSYEGYKLEVVAAWPDAYPTLTYYDNFHIGLGRAMRVDREYRPRKLAVEYTIHGKVDANYAVSEMIAMVDIS